MKTTAWNYSLLAGALAFCPAWAQPASSTTSNRSASSPNPAGADSRLARIRASKMPAMNQPVAFNTPAADAILSALEVFPPDNPWNQIISDWPVHPNSRQMVASVGNDKPLRYNPDMGFVLVPPQQPRIDVRIVGYPGESDLDKMAIAVIKLEAENETGV